MNTVFVSYPADAARLGRLITGQRLETSDVFAMVESLPTDEVDPGWEAATRKRVEGADAVLALVTRHSENSDEQRFELRTARDGGKPILGLRVYADDAVPPELDGAAVTDWTWEAIVDWIDSLPED